MAAVVLCDRFIFCFCRLKIVVDNNLKQNNWRNCLVYFLLNTVYINLLKGPLTDFSRGRARC